MAALLASLVVLLLVAVPVEASVLRGLTVKQLRDRAETIVAGKVISVRTERSDGRIETVARVRVQRRWRGTKDRVVTVRTLGGRLGGRRLLVAGAATLQRGDHVLLFLYRNGEQWRPVGMFQGVWRLDGEDAEIARASDSGGASLLRPASGAPAVETPARTVRQLAGRVRGGQ